MMADIQQYWNKFKQIEEEYIGIEDGIDNFEENELPYNVNDIRRAKDDHNFSSRVLDIKWCFGFATRISEKFGLG